MVPKDDTYEAFIDTEEFDRRQQTKEEGEVVEQLDGEDGIVADPNDGDGVGPSDEAGVA